jgi:hypothetical protein
MLTNPLHLFYSRKGIPASARTSRMRSYLIAFPMKTMAKRVEPYMYEKASFEIRSNPQDPFVSPISDALIELGIDPRKYQFQYTYNDKPGYLVISKEVRQGVHQCNPIERSLIDIITYPFVKNIGIIIPLERVHEDDLSIILESRLIEPDGRVELFRKDLEQVL